MPMMILNLALLFVFGLASIQFSFINREDLSHGTTEFTGRLLDLMNRSRHVATVSFHDLERNASLEKRLRLCLSCPMIEDNRSVFFVYVKRVSVRPGVNKRRQNDSYCQ